MTLPSLPCPFFFCLFPFPFPFILNFIFKSQNSKAQERRRRSSPKIYATTASFLLHTLFALPPARLIHRISDHPNKLASGGGSLILF